MCLKAGRSELEKFIGGVLKVIYVNEVNQRLCKIRRTREPCVGPKKCQHLKRRARNRLKKKQTLTDMKMTKKIGVMKARRKEYFKKANSLGNVLWI